MPIEVGFWNVTDKNIQKIDFSSIDSEEKLEEIISKEISILSDDLLVVDRQVLTAHGKKVDLLSINQEGKITVIELKKNKTPREVIAQTLDYASWVKNLSYSEIKAMFEKYHKKTFETLFEEKFGNPPPEKINQEHDMLIVCSELDNETERILNYLSDDYNVPVNAVFFRFFKDNNTEYLSRSWLIDPTEVEEKSSKSKLQNKGESWNGRDFVVNIDQNEDRTISSWEDSQKYDFVSAGGGKWYSQSLNQLFPGARIFAMIPKKGYVGVGTVEERSVPIKDFVVKEGKKEKSILDVPLKFEELKMTPDDIENCNYFVKVKWEKKNPEKNAYWEKGLRAKQNSAFKLKSKFTLDKLTKHFSLEE